MSAKEGEQKQSSADEKNPSSQQAEAEDEAAEAPVIVKKLDFAPRISTSNKTTERLRDREEFELRMKRLNSPEKQLKKLKEKWKEEKEFYKNEMKPSEDQLVGLFGDELGITRLNHTDLIYIFEKFRELRELQLRLRNLEALKLFRVLIGEGKSKMALDDMLGFIQHDAMIGMQYVDEEDYKISGISDDDKELILKNIDLDPDNDEECDKWVSYILFFCNPANEWLRIRRRFEKLYFSFLDTSMIQALVNNDSDTVNALLMWKPPLVLESCTEGKLKPIVRADQHFSSYKRNSCLDGCEGHRGKLLLLMIRMRQSLMVSKCLSQGISPTSQCCTGQVKSLFWDTDPKSTRKDDDEAPDSKPRKGRSAKRKAVNDPNINLRTQYDYETALSTAVSLGHAEIVDKLLAAGANPLRCDDAAIRACVKIVLNKDEGNAHQNLVMAAISDNDYIFKTICTEAQKRLLSAQQRRKFVPPNYCTIALLYQAVVEDIPDAAEILTEVRGTKNSQKRKAGGQFSQVLSKYTISNSLPADVKKSKETRKLKIFNPLGKKKAPDKKNRGRSVNSEFAAKSVSSNGTYLLNGEGVQIKVNDMNEDLCYIIVMVIDKLIIDLSNPKVANVSRALNGIRNLLEIHNLYLDRLRFERLLSALVEGMAHAGRGDHEAIQKFFLNSQFRYYLKFDPASGWDDRSVEKFIKHDKVKMILKFKGRNAHGFADTDDKETMLEKVLVQAARLDLPLLIGTLHRQRIRPSTETLEDAIIYAAEEGNPDSMEKLAELYGKKLLSAGFAIALANSSIDSIQAIVDIDSNSEDSSYSLVDDVISSKLKTRPERPEETVLATASRKEKAQYEADELPVDLVLEFFFVCSEIPISKVRQILLRLFKDTTEMNCPAIEKLVKTATKGYAEEENFVNGELLEVYLASKPIHYDEKDNDVQIEWLNLLLYMYKFGANENSTFVDDFNDRVVALLEQKQEFRDVIQYDGSDHGIDVDDEDDDDMDDVEIQEHTAWGHQSELL